MLKTIFRWPPRRAVVRIHLWSGLVLGAYLALVSTTGVVLLFKDDLQALSYSHLYVVDEKPANGANGHMPGIDKIMESMKANFPNHRIIKIEAPKTGRESVGVITENNGRYDRQFGHPLTGELLGTLPANSLLSYIASLHENLLMGKSGRFINCTLALLSLLLLVTGIASWWPRTGHWRASLGPTSGSGKMNLRSVHQSLGIWTSLFLIVFVVTGALFFYDRYFNAAVERLSDRSPRPVFYSDTNAGDALTQAKIQPMIERARLLAADRNLWGIFMPSGGRNPVHVVFGPVGREIGRDRWDLNESGQRNFFFDQYTGKVLHQWDTRHRSLADFAFAWPTKLHTGEFGGQWSKVAWTTTGVAPLLLFVLGFAMWRRRPRSRR